MIKFAAENLIGFGLSDENIKRLRQGKPIGIMEEDTDALGISGKKIMIFYGKTEADMEKQLREAGFITSETKIHGEVQNMDNN